MEWKHDTKFARVLSHPEIKITFSEVINSMAFPALFQKWNWGGISADCLVFDASDLGPQSDSELEASLRSAHIVQPTSAVTIKRCEGYVYVSFNFAQAPRN